MKPLRSKKHIKKTIIALTAILIVVGSVVLALLWVQRASAPKPAADLPHMQKPKKKREQPAKEPEFNKSLYSTTDPASLWVVVNKAHPLNPRDFIPSDLTSAAGGTVSQKMAADLTRMIADAKAAGISLRIVSSYRSYQYQVGLYNSYVQKDGQAEADTYSARPGHSEHQTGLAVDLGGTHGCELEQCFGDTPEGQWLAQNANSYGFIVRYQEQNQAITGYSPEPWHLRYVGAELAQEMQRLGITSLEEMFGIPGGATYAQ